MKRVSGHACCYSVYIAAQFYPSFGTLVPASIIVGIGAAPMWSAKCTYLTQVGNRYGNCAMSRNSNDYLEIYRNYKLFELTNMLLDKADIVIETKCTRLNI